MLRVLAAILALCAAAIPARIAAAQTAEDRAAADALFAEAKRLLADGKTDEACAKFAASLELVSRLGTRLNLADCYERAGKTASAWATFRTAEAEARKAGDNRETFAHDRVQALGKRLTNLRVVLQPDAEVPDLEVKRDGVTVPRAALGTSVPVDPGQHHIEAKAPGYNAWSIDVKTGAEGDSVEVSIPPLEKAPVVETPPDDRDTNPPAPPVDPKEAARRRHTRRVIAVAAGGVGVAGIAVGGVFAFMARSKWSDAQPHCGADNSCDTKGYDLTQDARSAGNIATIAMAVGGAALVTGVVLWLTAPSVPAERHDDAAAFRITPVVDPSGSAFVTVQGAF